MGLDCKNYFFLAYKRIKFANSRYLYIYLYIKISPIQYRVLKGLGLDRKSQIHFYDPESRPIPSGPYCSILPGQTGF